jgi:ubiquinol-cytochrome c reductase cytochrome c subunit
MSRWLLVLAFCLTGPLTLPASAPADPLPQGIVHPKVPPGTSLVELGYQLYAGNCATCHGAGGRGIATPTRGASGERGQGPPLRGVGALAPDFYLRTGYMPLSQVGSQPHRSRVLFDEREIRALIAYVASLGRGPPVPAPNPRRGNVSEGQRLFAQHCAGCHQVVAKGGYLPGAIAPQLVRATPVQIAEAVRIGPFVMPTFSKRQISDRQLDSIVAYVQETKHPDDRGGWSLGHIGPVPEGLVSWLLAAAVLVVVCVLIGKRVES